MTRPTSRRHGWQSAAPGSALATVLLLPAWGAALSLRSTDLSWLPWLQLLGLTAVCGWLTALAACLPRQLSWHWRWAPWFPLLLALGLFGLDTWDYLLQSARFTLIELGWLDRHKELFRGLLWGLAAAALPGAYVLRRRWRAASDTLVLMLCALTALLATQYAYQGLRGEPSAPTVRSGGAPTRPVVVVVFDELDSQLLTELGPELPGFRELAERARVTGNVYPPSNYTHISVPAMLTGQPLVGADTSGDTLVLAAADGKRVSLGRHPNLLSVSV